ncbi:LytR family transcriptional regulator [Euhalothece natronophila Z-M001]|uniref:LytR family transcriptional regulator n=1 Tax=Euhalothece natronophila Z-M001 TaxID=522448 RepID=A0A5B8NR04_9CHRO|nr:LytR family transcriptional regulator [Euhalothece natronophila Z-M001]
MRKPVQVQNSKPSSRPKRTYPVKKKKEKQRSRSPHWFLIGLGLSGIAMLSATAGAFLAITLGSTNAINNDRTASDDDPEFSREEITNTPPLQLPKLKQPVNLLVLGTKVLSSDLGESPRELGYHRLVHDSFDGATDAMFLVRFDPEADKVTMLSIPRDSKVDLPGHGTVKINAANRYGGAGASARAVSNLLGGVEIDRYIRVNVQGVEQLVDALGGVDMYVPKDMRYRDDSQRLYIDLEQGEQTLDGEEAMQFIRFRQDEYGDIGRVQRQQLLLRAMVQQALNPSTLTRIPNILSVIRSNLDTNLGNKEMLALARFASNRDDENLEMLMLPGEFEDVVENRNGRRITTSYWLPHNRRIEQMMARHFDVESNRLSSSSSDEVSPRIRIAIQDSTDNSEAVRGVARDLEDDGFRNVYVASDWSQPLETTRIVAQTGNVEAAKAVAEVLGVGEVRVESTGALDSVVSIQLGEDWWEKQESE